MACVVGYGTYRFEEVDHAIPIRIVGPNGRQYRQLSRAASRRFQDAPNRMAAVRDVSLIVFGLNAASDLVPDAAEVFERDVAGCREVQDAFITALKIRTRSTPARDGSKWLFPKPHIHRKVAGALSAMCSITDLLRDECYGGRDPSKVDPNLSRTGGASAVLTRTKRGIRLDTDRRLRVASKGGSAPRCEDPRFFERLLDGLRATGASPAVEGLCRLSRFSGGRFCSVSTVSMYDYLCRAKAGKVGKHIPATSKGAKGEFPLNLIPGDATMAWIDRYVDGPRKRLTGQSLSSLRWKAANPKTRDELKAMPLFTEDGVNGVSYPRLYRAFRKAAERAGLWIDDEEYQDTGCRRFVTFHWLRHEYVHTRLDAVALMSTKIQQENEKKSIIAYMGWASSAMLRWYSAHHTVKLAIGAAERHNERSDVTVQGGSFSPKSTFNADKAECDAMMLGLA